MGEDQQTSNPSQRPITWLTLPNKEPGILVRMFDIYKQVVYNEDDAYAVTAIDRFKIMWEFEVEYDTFQEPWFN